MIVAILVAYVVLVYALQRAVVYPGAESQPRHEVSLARTTWIGVDENTKVVLLPPAASAAKARNGVVIFAHGNAERVDEYVTSFSALRSAGFAVALVEYPGYGTPGAPSEDSIQQAMLDAYDWLIARSDIDHGRVVLMGRSLGGGAVCNLLKARPASAVILVSTFANLGDLSRRSGVPGLLMRDNYDNVDALQGFEGPVMVIHGKSDEIIPRSAPRKLAAAAKTSVVWRDGGHNDITIPWPDVVQFLESV